MSDITGTGYGAEHSWRRGGTQYKTTFYKCDCGETFAHHYSTTPNIFTAMKDAGVSETCRSQQQKAAEEPSSG